MPTHCFYEPGATNIQDIAVKRNGAWRGGYSGDTEAEMLERAGAVLVPWDDAFEAMTAAQRAAHVKPPIQITREQFFEALGALPPCRWTQTHEAESFHISELLTGDLASWYVWLDDTFWAFTETQFFGHDRAVALVKKAPLTLPRPS